MSQDIIAICSGVTIEATAESSPQTKVKRFDIEAYNGGPLKLPNFPHPVVVELSSLRYASSIVANLDHDRTKRVGHIEDRANDGRVLRLSGFTSAETPFRDEAVQSAANGFRWQASIEANRHDSGTVENVPAGRAVSVNHQTFRGPIHVARNFLLTGVALCSHGADGTTSVSIAAQQAGPEKGLITMPMELTDFITASGFDVATLSEPQLAFLRKQHGSQQSPASPKSLDEVFAAQRLESDRVSKIADIAARSLSARPYDQESIEAAALMAEAEKWEPMRFEVEMLRQDRPQARAPRGSRRDELNGQVIEAALCKSVGMQNIEASFKPEVLDAADRQYKHGLGLQEALYIAARNNGFSGSSVKNDLRGALEHACQSSIKATGFSTFSLPTTLGNVANKIIRDGYNFVEQEWRKIAYIGTYRDFKTNTTVTPTGDMTFEELGKSGEIPHGSVGEEVFTNRVRPYGKMFSISLEDWVNDDLGAFQRVRNSLGRGAANAINKKFWTIFLNNSTFFSAGNGNFLDGVGTAFSDTSLADAEVLFKMMLGPDGELMGATPKILVVPPQLAVAVRKLMTSTTTNAADNKGTDNPWAGMFQVVSSAFMANTAYTGYSTKKWYMIADPNDVPVIEVGFLNGQQYPTVESANADFDKLGMAFRGYFSFGVSLQNPRGGVAMKGEA